MSTVTASILIGGRHRYRGGIQPGWLVLLHEGSRTAWQLVRLQLFQDDEAGALDGAPGVRWISSDEQDLAGQLALLLHLHVAQSPDLVQAVRGAPRLLEECVLDLDELAGAEASTYQNAVQLARTTGGEHSLALTTLRGSRLDGTDLMSLSGWEIDLAQTVRSRDWIPSERRLVHRRSLPDLLDDSEIAVSRFITGVVMGGPTAGTAADFLRRSATGPQDKTVDTLARWTASSLAALALAGAFDNGASSALAPVLDDLTPNQARLLSGFLPDRASTQIPAIAELAGSGDPARDLLDLYALACRVTGHALAVASNTWHLPPWLVVDSIDPSTPRTLTEYVYA